MQRALPLPFLCLLGLLPPFLTAQTPVIDAIVNSASFQAGPAAAGSLVSLFGKNLSASGSNNVVVKMGDRTAPLLYVSSGQINTQVPWELASSNRVAVTVSVNGAVSAEQNLTIGSAAPGIFLSLPSATRKAGDVRRGDLLTLLATGLGDVKNRPATGAPASGDLSPLSANVNVAIGGKTVTPSFAGLAPSELLGIDSIGMYQVDVQIPSDADLGDRVPVTISVAGATSNAVMVAIREAAPQKVLYAWMQFGPDGLIARAISSQPNCPALSLDGKPSPMQVRAKASAPLFPVLSCELAIPSTVASVSLGDAALPLANPNASRITLIGDTGCRLDTTRIQSCNDPVQWPTAVVAANAAATQPDLFIQLGDYHYREVPCPAGNAGCAGTPWGYSWAVWNADFFDPMTPVFPVAPMVIIRGNHEMCDRAGEGWFRFLDPRPFPSSCQKFMDPYTVQAGPTQLFVIDSSEATDTTADPELVARFVPYLNQLAKVVTPNTWVVMHHPMWGFDSTGTRNLSLQTASQNTLPDGVQLMLAGHIHTFQTLTFAPSRPPQMIAGNSGDVLQAYPATTTSFTGRTIAGATVTEGNLYKDFGFTTMEWTGTDWTAIARDVNGSPVMTCVIGNAQVKCGN